VNFEGYDLKAERVGRRLKLAHFEHDRGIADIAHNRQSSGTRDNFAQKFQSLASEVYRLS
jgi:hypothetical protein